MLQTKKGLSWLKNANGDIDQSSEGYNVAITSLTYIRKKVVDQVFYEIPIEEFIPIAIGEGAYSESIVTYGQVSHGGDFESGIVNTGADNARLQTVDTGVVKFTAAVADWMKGFNYTKFDVEKALLAGNWDIIAAKAKALKKNFDLGLQELAFLGGKGIGATLFPGLLNNGNVNSNISLITEDISTMSAAELDTLAAGLLESYRSNNNRTLYPTHWAMPEDVYNGLSRFTDVAFGLRSRLAYLEEAFKGKGHSITIYPVKYGMSANNSLGLTRHCLYNKEEDNLILEIPLNFVLSAPGTANNVTFQQVAMSQFTGVLMPRPLAALYFDY